MRRATPSTHTHPARNRGRREGARSILPSASCRVLGNGVGCRWVLRVAFGFGCSAFAVVSISLFAGSRSVLLLVAPCGGGFVCPLCWFAFGVGSGPSRLAFVLVACGGFVFFPFAFFIVYETTVNPFRWQLKFGAPPNGAFF